MKVQDSNTIWLASLSRCRHNNKTSRCLCPTTKAAIETNVLKTFTGLNRRK
jgi:hypothetical protein